MALVLGPVCPVFSPGIIATLDGTLLCLSLPQIDGIKGSKAWHLGQRLTNLWVVGQGWRSGPSMLSSLSNRWDWRA